MSGISPYYEYKDTTCIKGSVIIQSDVNPDGFVNIHLWKKWTTNNPNALLQRGGNGRVALFALSAVPEPYYSQILARWGHPKEVHNPLQPYFKLSGEARAYYSGYRREDGSYLRPEQIERFTVNASTLDAIALLEAARTNSRKARGGSVRGSRKSPLGAEPNDKHKIGSVKATLTNDCIAFAKWQKQALGGICHTLPENERRLFEKLRDYQREGYGCLIDGRDANKNAQVVTPAMLRLWKDIYAGQRGLKPTYTDVYIRYRDFLAGHIDIISAETGEVYDAKKEDFRPASERTVASYQQHWENRIATHAARSGDRQEFKAIYEPYHKLNQPKWAGSMISIDDRQPPFAYATGQRMWFYNGIDLGSEAFTTWVWGETKEGIILDFYRQMVRNYTEWGLNLPYELEAEMSLNSLYVDSFLKDGAMFQKTRIEANNARGKRIEAYYRPLRYQYEKNRIGWLARPFALSESNQKGADKVPLIAKDEIITGCLRDIQTWNNELHSNQDLHPGMSRWDVFMDKQHPQLTPTNWAAILPHLGYVTSTSMKAGRITLQGMHRIVGIDGQVAIGDTLIDIMRQIEGEQVDVYWLDGNGTGMLKALVFDKSGRMVCELLDDLSYSRSTLERSPEDAAKREIMSAYAATVQAYVRREKKEIGSILIMEKEQEKSSRFQMPGLERYIAPEVERVAEILAEPDEMDLVPVESGVKISTADRF